MMLALIFAVGCQAKDSKINNSTQIESKNISYYGGVSTKSQENNSLDLKNNNTSKIKQKIIKNAFVKIESTNLKKIDILLKETIKKYNGYINNSNKRTGYSNQKFYNYTIRIPQADFKNAISEISSLGKILEESITSNDVTKQYLDYEIRLKNLNAQHQKYLELLKQAKNVKDILEIERELNRVKTEIEQIKGSLKYYDNQVELSTIRLSIQSPEPIVDNNSNWGIANSLKQSIKAFVQNIALIIIFIGAAIPWLILLSICAYILYKSFKKLKK